jgi:TatD DNase family protein
MVETDCPYLAPVPYRGKRAEPAHTRLVAEKIAEVRGITLEEVAEATTRTAEGFFRFSR